MKHAKIYIKNELGKQEFKGTAILLNCMDKESTRGFWEYKYPDGIGTFCGWIPNKDVFE